MSYFDVFLFLSGPYLRIITHEVCAFPVKSSYLLHDEGCEGGMFITTGFVNWMFITTGFVN